MDKFVIKGGKPLKGEVTISGAKNAALAIIPACILVEGPCCIENIPRIDDVYLILEILEKMGASVKHISETTVCIDCTTMTATTTPSHLARKMRASYYTLGALLGRFSRAQVDLPGGCNFGSVRPIDQHIKGLEALGASIRVEYGMIYASAQKMHGAEIYLDIESVGATINIMLAAAKAEGMTIIENAAKEPHIVDLANFLNSMGANIMGAGTDVIKIRGVKTLRGGGTYSIIPDQIEGRHIHDRGCDHRRRSAGEKRHSQASGLHIRKTHRGGRIRHGIRRFRIDQSRGPAAESECKNLSLSRLPDRYAAADVHAALPCGGNEHRYGNGI